ncbi:MAG TPA: TonB-dependent receptor [Cyclobacteriaceae bacterium]|nr:TonB-dependent receptor [Cyclobacteriaceae bacterium]
MRKFLRVVFLLLLFSATARAQERTVSGKVTSAEDGSAIPGVNVIVKGTTTGTTTDANGSFQISVPANATLVFSFIGFATLEVNAAELSVVDAQLSVDATQLSEVVVVGYSTVAKKELTGAVSSVKGSTIANLPLQSFDRALQGRAAGVQVLSANGAPGGAVSVRIRGTGSITAGNEPLYIVDGVQINTRNDGGTVVSNNPLAFLNPNDIESMEILKDAANASIYGSQAANGVVIITTKKGKAAQKTQINLGYYKGIVEPLETLDMMSTQDWIQARQEALLNTYPTLTPQEARNATLAGRAASPGIPAISGIGFPATMTDDEIAAIPNYDWQGEAFKPGSIDNFDASLSAGNETTTLYSSFSYNKQEGSLIKIDFERINGKMNVTHKINDRLSLDLGFTLSSITQNGPYGDARGTTAFGAPQYASPTILPFNPIYIGETKEFFGLPASNVFMVGDLTHNVIATATYIKQQGKTNQLVGNAAFTYKLMDGLTVKAFGGLDYRNMSTKFYGDPRLNDYYAINGTSTVGNSLNVNVSTNVTLNYVKTFGSAHNVGAFVGAEYRQENNEGMSFTGRSFPTPDFTTANAAAIPFAVGGFGTGFKRAGLFGNFKYDYDKKYLLSVTMRYDGSSRFGINNQYGFFPSVSGAWNVNEEGFLKSSSFVSDLRLRLSWGQTGNDQIGNFDSRGLYTIGGTYNGVTGIVPTMGNADLRWEKNETTNIGIDYGFFGSRIAGSIDVFRRLSKDLLLTQSVAQTSGFNSVTSNVGEVKNEGLEFELRSTNVDFAGFKWETNFNITFLRNEVVSLFDGLDVLPGNLNIRVGYPLGTNTNNLFAGVNPANGRPMHYDINGNITYLRQAADIVPTGAEDFSNMYGGFTNTFGYKGLELAIFFQYDYGRTVANLQHFRMADMAGVLRNSNQYFYDNRWTTPGQITDVPAPANGRTQNTATISSYQTTARFYEDASFIRLKQLTLSYNLPSSMLSRLKLVNVRLYAQAINLVTWTKWTGYDPEFRDTGNGSEGILPQTKNYTLGVQIGL